ncbi:MAG: hypothetical protein RSB02_08945, partial [Anaerovoracaceae bacterium]
FYASQMIMSQCQCFVNILMFEVGSTSGLVEKNKSWICSQNRKKLTASEQIFRQYVNLWYKRHKNSRLTR